MSIITLTTDWNANDFYVGAIKGKILSQCPHAIIIDISHRIQPFNITQAAFVIRNTYQNFPDGSIHIICVNTEGGQDKPFLAIKYKKHFFIGTDNGIFGLIIETEPEKIISIKTAEKITSFTAFSLFSVTACKLANDVKIESLGKQVKSFNKRIPIRAAIEESVINGSVIYIDSYKNAITNVTRELFERVGKNRPFEIYVRSNHYKINKINTFYYETSPGEILAIFNSVGLLEIAMNMGNVADLLDLSVNSSIRIKFLDK
jgi:S-adenosylmethionine hydrolase